MDSTYVLPRLDENGLPDAGVLASRCTFERGAQASVAWTSTRRNIKQNNARFIVSFFLGAT